MNEKVNTTYKIYGVRQNSSKVGSLQLYRPIHKQQQKSQINNVTLHPIEPEIEKQMKATIRRKEIMKI